MQNSGNRALKQAPVRRRKRRTAPPTPALPPARLAYLAGRIHTVGPRGLYELLLELQQGAPLVPRLEAYARLAELEPFLRAQGGDRLPPTARLVTPTRKGRGRP
jgi:hypothetical protein